MIQKVRVGIVLPTTGFRRFMFFNPFCVEREEGFVRIQHPPPVLRNLFLTIDRLVIMALRKPDEIVLF